MSPDIDPLTLALGKEQVLQLIRARVAQVMTEHVDSGRLALSTPLDYRAGWAVALLARIVGIPVDLRHEWAAQPQVEALGLALARFHEQGMLDRALDAGPWEGCER